MNLTDLSAELESQAEHLNTGAAMARLAGVRGRVRARRRRQAGAAALIAAGCVLAVVLGPNLSVLRADRSSEPASTQHHVKPYTFDDVLAGDPLLASAVGVKGQSEVVLRFTPADNYLQLGSFCSTAKDQTGLWGTTTVNGHSFLGGDCRQSSVANGTSGTPGGDSAAENRAGWAAMGVVPGRESVIRIRLETGKYVPRTDPSVRLGIGVYAMTGDRITSNGVVLKLDAEADGHDYRLANYLIRPVSQSVRQLRLPVPAGRWPVYVIGGTGGKIDDNDAGRIDVSVVGEVPNSSSDGGGVMGLTLANARAQTVQVHTTGSSGVLVVAYYVRVD
jgi:hypothetical protein